MWPGFYQEPDQTTKLDSSFAVYQEAARNHVERGFGVTKIKFWALTYPINLHDWDDIYYVFIACFFMHNMMVEAQCENDEVEDGPMYNMI
jgi:hypothetical protein